MIRRLFGNCYRRCQSTCRVQVRTAAKLSSGYSPNQRRKGGRKYHQIMVYLGYPTRAGELICDDPKVYGKTTWRPWKHHPGKNVTVDDKRNFYAATHGVPTVRRSVINPAYRWIDVEPDIQKVYRINELRKEFEARNERHVLSRDNLDYVAELADCEDPNWRQDVQAVKPLTERFKDPNLLCRGIVTSLDPGERYTYK